MHTQSSPLPQEHYSTSIQQCLLGACEGQGSWLVATHEEVLTCTFEVALDRRVVRRGEGAEVVGKASP